MSYFLAFFVKISLNTHGHSLKIATARRRSAELWRGEVGGSMSELLKTPLTDWHIENGAKMAEFAGYSMPIYYPTGALKEIQAVRNFSGLFDISHMRPIFVEGTLAREFLDFIDTRDLSGMKKGDAKYGIVCNEAGEPIDDIIVYMLSANRFLVISNAANGTRVYEHMRNVKMRYRLSNSQVTFIDGRGKFGFISLQGPCAEAILSEAMPHATIPKKYYSCRYGLPFGYLSLVAKTGYTGESGFEILCRKTHTIEIWTRLLEVGCLDDIIPAGLAARDTLRLEAGMPLFGQEMDKDHDPITAGLGWAVNFTDNYFIGKYALEKVRDGKVDPASPKATQGKYFHAFIMGKGRVPRHGNRVMMTSSVFEKAGTSSTSDTVVEIGKLTSAGYSPTLGKNIAMGYLAKEFPIGTGVFIEIEGKFYEAKVTKHPFYKRVKK